MQTQTGAAEQAVVEPPQVVCDVPGLRLWHKMDAEFRTPRANAYFLLTSPTAYDSPRAAALTHLTIKLLEVSYEGSMADVQKMQRSITTSDKMQPYPCCFRAPQHLIEGAACTARVTVFKLSTISMAAMTPECECITLRTHVNKCACCVGCAV